LRHRTANWHPDFVTAGAAVTRRTGLPFGDLGVDVVHVEAAYAGDALFHYRAEEGA
jgi:hypothetical protein